MKKITLKDIAEVTGLSINSVSRALKDKDSISLETRKMVQQVAKDMGYIPNSLASSMRSGRTDSIAIILGEMVNPYNAYLMNHLTTHLHDRGYTTPDVRHQPEAFPRGTGGADRDQQKCGRHYQRHPA